MILESNFAPILAFFKCVSGTLNCYVIFGIVDTGICFSTIYLVYLHSLAVYDVRSDTVFVFNQNHAVKI